MPIPLRWDGTCLSWPYGKDRKPSASSEDLRHQIAKSAGLEVPNCYLASFGPDDVVIGTDGYFWITPEWEVLPLPAEALAKIEKWISIL